MSTGAVSHLDRWSLEAASWSTTGLGWGWKHLAGVQAAWKKTLGLRASRNMFHKLRESTCFKYICFRTNAKLGFGLWAYRIKRDFNFRRDGRACMEDSQVQVDEIVEALCGAPIFASLEKGPSTRLICDDPNCFVLHFGVTLVQSN